MTGLACLTRQGTRLLRAVLALLAFAATLTIAVAQVPSPIACDKAEAPCKVSLGSYYIALPETALPPGKRRPVVLFFHGAGGMGVTVL